MTLHIIGNGFDLCHGIKSRYIDFKEYAWKHCGSNSYYLGVLEQCYPQVGSNGAYCVLELDPRFGGGFPFSYEAGVNLPKAILSWLRGEDVDSSMLIPQYGRMFSKNDYLMEIKCRCLTIEPDLGNENRFCPS